MQDPNKTTLSLAIEVVLMKRGGDRYYHTLFKLRNLYDCEIEDGYDKPQYLKNIFKEVYGNEYDSIVEDIRLELGDSVKEKEIARVMSVLEEEL